MRDVTYGIEWPAIGLSSTNSLSIDLQQVAAAAVKEVLQTQLTGLSLSAFIEDLLVPRNFDQRLVWRRDGPGLGVEVRRGFSGLLGRFFARWYLQENHAIRYFYPISGAPAKVSARLVITRTGNNNLPDWFCAGTGGVALAEAKGSHAKFYASSPSMAPPLKLANEQLESANVYLFNQAGQFFMQAKVKGWGVMSRWATQENELDPLLFVIDPETQGHEPSDDDIGRMADDIARVHYSLLLAALGFGELSQRLPKIEGPSEVQFEQKFGERFEGASAEMPSPRQSWRQFSETTYVQAEGIEPLPLLGSIIDAGGRPVRERVSSLLNMRTSMSKEQRGSLFFAGFDQHLIQGIIEQPPGSFHRPRLFRRGNSQTSDLPTFSMDEDGFVLASFDLLSHAQPAPDDLRQSLE